MSDYAFEHNGKAYTPNQTEVTDVDAHNAAIESAELNMWREQPLRILGYYKFPAEHLRLFGRPRLYLESFSPLLHTYVNKATPDGPGIACEAVITAWRGIVLGRITYAKVYRHNLGGRFVSIRVQGSNGAEYYGRASYDNGSCILLKKAKS